jgi:hypothetical protein
MPSSFHILGRTPTDTSRVLTALMQLSRQARQEPARPFVRQFRRYLTQNKT